MQAIHWNGNVVILMKLSSLAALKVVKMTTSSAARDENFVKMTTFSFQCIEAEVQWPPFCRRHFKINFLNDTHCILNAFNWTLIQAIIRINDGLVYWRKYASLGLNNLNLCFSLWIRYCIGYRETTPSKDYLCLRKHPLNITFLY